MLPDSYPHVSACPPPETTTYCDTSTASLSRARHRHDCHWPSTHEHALPPIQHKHLDKLHLNPRKAQLPARGAAGTVSNRTRRIRETHEGAHAPPNTQHPSVKRAQCAIQTAGLGQLYADPCAAPKANVQTPQTQDCQLGSRRRRLAHAPRARTVSNACSKVGAMLAGACLWQGWCHAECRNKQSARELEGRMPHAWRRLLLPVPPPSCCRQVLRKATTRPLRLLAASAHQAAQLSCSSTHRAEAARGSMLAREIAAIKGDPSTRHASRCGLLTGASHTRYGVQLSAAS
jgi:hypothetical protein